MKSQDWSLLKRIFLMFLDYKRQIFLIFICLLIYLIVSFITPFLSKMIIDDGIMNNDYDQVLLLSMSLFLLVILHSIANIVKEKIRIAVSLDVYNRLISRAFEALLNIKISYFNSKNSTEIITELEVDTNNILLVFGENVFFAVTEVLTFFGGIVGLFIIDYRMACIVFLFIPIKYVVVNILGSKRRLSIHEFIEAKNDFAHWIGDTLEGMKEIRASGLEERQKENLDINISPVIKKQKQLEILNVYNSDSEKILYGLLESILYILGVKYIFSGSITIGSLFAFITYSMYVVSPISSILNIHYSLAGVLPSAKRYYGFIDKAKREEEKSGNILLNDFTSINFLNVTFAYDNKKILRDASFSINKGEHIAIVGRNGSGKSTIFNLLQKFYEPDSGKITINNIFYDECEKRSFRNLYSCINQDSYIFDIGILNNIHLYQDQPDGRINNVLKESMVDDFYEEKQINGTGQNGSNLSGGQRQKVLLARLLMRDKEIYLLDEATANLDAYSEEHINKIIETTLRNKTVVIISHKKKFLTAMDKILSLQEDGTVITYNSYAEMEKSEA